MTLDDRSLSFVFGALHLIAQNADALYLEFDDVAMFQPAIEFEAAASAHRS